MWATTLYVCLFVCLSLICSHSPSAFFSPIRPYLSPLMCVLIKRVYFRVESRISARKALISTIHVPLLAEAVASESVCTLLYNGKQLVLT